MIEQTLEIANKNFVKKWKLILYADYAVVFIFFLLLNFQWLGIDGWIPHPKDGQNAVKIYHIFGMVILPSFLLIKGNLHYKLPYHILIFLGFAIVWSTIAYYLFTPNKLIIHYIFALGLFFCTYHLQKSLLQRGPNLILRSVRHVTIIIYVLVLAKYFLYFDVISSFLKNPYGHPMIPTFYGGGINLEATWIAMSTIFFLKRKRAFYFSIIFSLLISISYSSRVGFILTVASFGLYFLSHHISSKEKKVIWLATLSIFIAFLLFSIYNFQDVYVIKRFTQIGTEADKGSMGRLMLWENSFKAALENALLGYGAGNAVHAVERIGTTDFTEDNVHNYYLQVLLDFGIIGLLFLLLIVAKVLLYQKKTNFENEYGNYLILYFIASFIQFRGAEPLIWFVAGAYFASVQYFKSAHTQKDGN